MLLQKLKNEIIDSQHISAATMATAIEQIRAIIDKNPTMEAAELRQAFNEIIRQKKKRTNAVQKAMRELVTAHKKTSLARLRRELKAAFAEVHKDDEDVPAAPSSAYRTFVREQSILLRSDDAFANANQRERMVEIGKRWKAKKMGMNAPAEASTSTHIPSDLNSDDDLPDLSDLMDMMHDSSQKAAPSTKRSRVTAPPVTRRITRVSTKKT